MSVFKSVSGRILPKSEPGLDKLEEATELIDREGTRIRGLINQTPEGRLPSSSIADEISNLEETVKELVEISGHFLESVPNIDTIDVVMLDYKSLKLERLIGFIVTSDELTPFTTYNEVNDLATEEDVKIRPDLEQKRELAIQALFTHETFSETVLARIPEKLQVLGQSFDNIHAEERAPIIKFVRDFDVAVTKFPDVAKDEALKGGIQELEATLFLHEQAAILSKGESMPTNELAEYINTWAVYLDALDEETKSHKAVLTQAVNRCSYVYNDIVRQVNEMRAQQQVQGG